MLKFKFKCSMLIDRWEDKDLFDLDPLYQITVWRLGVGSS